MPYRKWVLWQKFFKQLISKRGDIDWPQEQTLWCPLTSFVSLFEKYTILRPLRG